MTRETFEANIARLRGRLLAIAGSRLPQSDVEDAVQNAVFSAWKHLDQLKNDDAFDAWIKQILINECTQLLREQKRRRQINNVHELHEIPNTQSEIPIYEALDEMKREERELLMLHHEQGYSIDELSQKLGASEDIVKMRLYRARRKLRIILISLLILLLGMAVAVGMGLLDVQWFFANRRAAPPQINTDRKSDISISYDGRYLTAEAIDAVWDTDALTLHFTYSLAGLHDDTVIVHNGNIGVDGERMDHIWIDDQILPVDQWANDRTVYTYYLDGWKLKGQFIAGSEDFLPDGKGESFIASLRFDRLKPNHIEALRTLNDEEITFESDIFIQNYADDEILEHGMLRAHVALPQHVFEHIIGAND